MKRKILSIMLGLCMVVGMMASASAAPNTPSTGGNVTQDPIIEDYYEESNDDTKADDVIPSTDITVSPVQDASKLPAEQAAVLTAVTEAINSAASTSDFIANTGLTSAVQNVLATINETAAVPVSMDDLEVAATFSVSSAGAAANVIANGGTVELSFKVDGISDGDTVVVLVFDGNNWSLVPAVVRGGRVVGQFSSLGTVVVMKADEAAASDYVSSPQTSGTNLESALICGAVLSLAVLALCIKRSRMA